MYIRFLVLFVTSCGLFANSFNAVESQQDYECPSMCICDLFMDLNRANCSHQHLIGPYIGMSSYVEVLDLSHNDITLVDSQCLSHLKHLMTLTMNDNSIDHIDLDAFAGLKKLNTVILSRNRLEAFDNRIFEQNPQLFSVDLAENTFMNLPNEPLIISQSLQMLDMKKCKMTNLPERVFEALPNIRSIDLSGNLLIVLNMGSFMPNDKLRLLNVEGNPLRCDANIEMVLVSMRRNRIKVFLQNCPESRTTSSAKFERMMVLPSTTTVATTKTPEPTPDARSNELTKVWRINRNETCPLNDTKQVCEMYNQCMANKLSQGADQEPSQQNEVDLKMSQHSLMEFVKVNFAFYAGLAIGTVFGMLIVCLMSAVVSTYFTPSKNSANESGERARRNRRNRSSVIRAESHCSADQGRSQPVPLLERREVVRSRRPTNSFFSLFYERPVRHRYFHQLNRSATNLVRRLSQSRLFLNTTRAENAEYRNNYSRTNTQESTETQPYQPNHIEVQSDSDSDGADTLLDRSTSVTMARSTSMPSMNPESGGAIDSHDPSAPPFDDVRSFASVTNVFFGRSETPPPPYIEVISDSGTTT